MNGARVLICEDEIVVAMLVELVLHEHGAEICAIAGSEEGALMLAADLQPTHAIVDVQLAPGDGCAVARELRRRYNSAVVFATANGQVVRCDPDLPCAVLIEKPYDPGAVVVALYAAREIADGLPAKLPPQGELVGH